MGRKYIIEIAERHTHYTDEGKPYNLYRAKGFNSLVFDDYGLKKLEKYDETFFRNKNAILKELEDTRKLLLKLKGIVQDYENLVKCVYEVNESNLKSKGTEYLVNFIEVQNGK